MAVAMNGRGKTLAATRRNMNRGKIPGRVTSQAGMYRNDGVSAFGNVAKGDLPGGKKTGGSNKS